MFTIQPAAVRISCPTLSPKSPKNYNMENKPGCIPKHGGYQKLITYQKAEIIYDGTIYITNRFVKK